jgi:hypothetical protein
LAGQLVGFVQFGLLSALSVTLVAELLAVLPGTWAAGLPFVPAAAAGQPRLVDAEAELPVAELQQLAAAAVQLFAVVQVVVGFGLAAVLAGLEAGLSTEDAHLEVWLFADLVAIPVLVSVH